MDALPVHGWGYSVAFHRAYEDLAATGTLVAPVDRTGHVLDRGRDGMTQNAVWLGATAIGLRGYFMPEDRRRPCTSTTVEPN